MCSRFKYFTKFKSKFNETVTMIDEAPKFTIFSCQTLLVVT